MIYRALSLLALLVSALWNGPGAAYAETRLALVIGNSSYRTVTVLPNPANDAQAMAELLRAAQFDVTETANLTQSDMRRAIRDFASKVAQIGPDTVALVYYAGHGVQIDGENYLVPVDADIRREADVPLVAMRLHDLMNILDAVPSKTRIVVLDACRNNPFSAINKTIGRGLAIVDAPKGTIVSYSTSPGATALDGAGDHSPFTAALVDIARRHGVPVEQTFKSVRIAVNETTDGQQTPWESSSLTSDFAFFPGKGGAPKAEDKGVTSKAEDKGRTVADWERVIKRKKPAEAFKIVLGADVVEAYQAYVGMYPLRPFGPRARQLLARRQTMIAWNVAVTLNTVAAYQTFLDKHSNSDLAATARRLLQRTKNRALVLGPQAVGGNAAPQVKIVEKIVKVPEVRVVEKIVKVPEVRIVEKIVKVPQVKVVRKVVRVHDCPPKKKVRRTRRKRSPSDDGPVFVRPGRPTYAPAPQIYINPGIFRQPRGRPQGRYYD